MDKQNEKNSQMNPKECTATLVAPEYSDDTAAPDTSLLDGHLLAMMAEGGAQQLRSNADEVNRLNVFPVPDGDTGDNMRMTIESGIAAIENMDSNDLAEIMTTLSHGMLLGARGNSGVILSQFFAGVAKGFGTFQRADAGILANALECGVKQAYSSVMTPTEGTILTVAREAVEYARAQLNPESTIRSLFADLIYEMHNSLNRTPDILSVLKEAGVVDSGGAGLLYIMDGFNRVLNGERIEALPASKKPGEEKQIVDFTSFGPDSVMEYGYCTEFLLQLQTAKTSIEDFDIEVIKEFLCAIGDSIVAFQTGSIVKVHVHTREPDRVLGYCRKFGEFLTVKIENMSVQHTEGRAEKEDSSTEEKPKAKDLPRKKYATVVACNGEGIMKLFTELGADAIVEGGQTSNPSTQDFLEAFEGINAEHIFVFPNNGNIVMAAKQAAKIYEDSCVHVLENKDIGTGYAALSVADLSDPDPESVLAGMKSAMASVTTGFVSPTVRDAEMNGVQITMGDYIAFVGKEILSSSKSKEEAAIGLADILLADTSKFMLTVLFGKDATGEDKEALKSLLAQKHPDTEIYYIDGEQSIYPYIFIAE